MGKGSRKDGSIAKCETVQNVTKHLVPRSLAQVYCTDPV